EADLLRSALAAAGVDAECLVTDPTRPTTVKRSLVGLAQHRHPQKMFRVDHESRDPLPDSAVAQAMAHVDRLLPEADVVCIEDYNKGVCSPALCEAVISAARRAGVPVLVDPAAIEDYSRYRGASAITPNRTEATGATGDKLPPEASPECFAPIARQLLDSLDLEASIVTLDKHGCLLLERNGVPTVVPTFARQVYDVTGAGDMVLAALAAARANGMGWHDAVRFANAAAGLEVEVFGVVPMPIERIHRECLMRERPESGPHAKLRTLEQAAVEAAALRSEGRKVVFANGCFDVLHRGHTSLLKRAADLGDFLIVAVNSDRSVRKLKGTKDPRRPINSERDRAEVLAALGCVGAVVIFDEDTADRAILAIRPDVVVKGGEYSPSQVPEAPTIAGYGGRLVLLDMIQGQSTTDTLARIRAADDPSPSTAGR
ncbi:MAG: PfkB family carbohydrate kinase, partial [Phycisphaerales bacterium]